MRRRLQDTRSHLLPKIWTSFNLNFGPAPTQMVGGTGRCSQQQPHDDDRLGGRLRGPGDAHNLHPPECAARGELGRQDTEPCCVSALHCLAGLDTLSRPAQCLLLPSSCCPEQRLRAVCISCGHRNPVPELLGLRSSSLASEHIAALPVNSPHVIAKTGAGAAASSDVTLQFSGDILPKPIHVHLRVVYSLCVLSIGCVGVCVYICRL